MGGQIFVVRSAPEYQKTQPLAIFISRAPFRVQSTAGLSLSPSCRLLYEPEAGL